eukprot:GFYU01006363.1.p1 GENE.GFYU01006363.1~~GFYU01006363.1.p1  ORF type:complete len:240 (-),score=22.88 GFYU01006363.1:109-828(-)
MATTNRSSPGIQDNFVENDIEASRPLSPTPKEFPSLYHVNTLHARLRRVFDASAAKLPEIPTQIVNPYGPMQLGYTSKPPTTTDLDGDSPTGLPAGPFVVFTAAPSGEHEEITQQKRIYLLYCLVAADLILIAFLFLESLLQKNIVFTLANGDENSASMGVQLLGVTLVSAVGVVGCRKRNPRALTFFIAAILMDFLTGTSRLYSIYEVVRYSVEISAVYLAVRIRSRMMAAWFSSARL